MTHIVRLEPGDQVVVTGATGFIGSAVTRALRARGARVDALIAPGVDDRNLEDTGARRVAADIRDAAAVRDLCRGARFVFHLAAVYRFWARDPRVFYDVNVGGTLNVLHAVAAAGCERLVFTSTVGVLGLDGARNGRPADETSYADLAHMPGHYKRSKFIAEHEVLRAAAQGLDVCLVLPTFPLGPGDVGPTPTGQVVLDFLNGRMPAFVDTALNVSHVDDLAQLRGSYKGSKFVAEHEVLRACAQGLDACLVLPTFPLGPGDTGPTPTGRVVLDYLNGKMPAFTDTAMNVVHVDDLASGHVAALERGGRGRSYILGGENLSMLAILQALADCTGLPMPRLHVPLSLVLAAGAASTLVQGRLLRQEPRVPFEAARMSTARMIFNDERARTEIGHTSRPAREAITESARWFAGNGYVGARRLAGIKWRA